METRRSDEVESGRSSTPCLVCRSRKVRCDRAIPVCRNCVRLGVACPGYDEDPHNIPRNQLLKSAEDIFKAAGKEKRRMGSCEQCRASKNLCTRARPSCRRCLVRGLTCVYRTKTPCKTLAELPATGVSRNLMSKEPERLNATPFMISGLEVDHQQLCSENLPEDPTLRSRLINTYFDRIHPLRCLAFIHKPSFLHAVDNATVVEDYGEPLLYIMCALGARLLFLDSLQSGNLVHPTASSIPGDAWAEKARKDVLSEAHVPSVQHLIALVLLCEHGLRTDQNAMVYVLSGYLFRAIRLLGLDAPHQTAISDAPSEILQREVENRIVWACYQIDLLLASGVERNSLWRGESPGIPLPCNNKEFLSPTISIPQFFLDEEDSDLVSVISQLDLPALVTVLIRIRATVLRLIRTALPTEPNISDPSSSFMKLIRKLEAFYDNIPDMFRLTQLNLYIHKDQHITGAVFFLHIIYHAAVFDLTRISLAGFSFPLAAAFASAPPGFRAECQKRCRFHANEVSKLIEKGCAAGQDPTHASLAFDQPFCADVTLESAKVQIIYTATVDNDAQSVEVTKSNLRTNLRLLKLLHASRDGLSPYIRAITSLCMVFGLQDIATEWHERTTWVSPLYFPGYKEISDPNPPDRSPDGVVEVTGSADIYHLSTMAPFRKARSEVRTKNASSTSPETVVSPAGLATSPKPSMLGQDRQLRFDMHDPSRMRQTNQSNTDEYLSNHTHSSNNQGPMTGVAYPNHHQVGNMEVTGISMAAHDAVMQPMQPSMEDYIRTADEMGNYLMWDISDASELPPWITFDLPYLPS